jgi:proline iminopeptidase
VSGLATHEILVDGIVQRFHTAGHGPLCLMHPGGPGVEWSYLRMPLVEEHVTAVYLEPVGTGGSGRLPVYSVGTYASFVDGVVEHLGGGPVHLLGHSYGGFVAQQYALDHPDRLAGLILYSSAPFTGPEFGELADRNAQRQAERLAHRPGMAAAVSALDADFPPDDAGSTASLRAIMPVYFADYWAIEDVVGPLRATIRSWHVDTGGEVFDVRDRLGAITAPALAVTGRYDWICEPSWSERMAAGIPGATALILPASGHFAHVEEPEAFAAAVAGLVGQARNAVRGSSL